MSTPTLPTIVERPLVKLDGAPISDALAENLVETRVELVTNGVGQATLRFYDSTFDVFEGGAGKIGGAVEISFPTPDSQQPTKVFAGEIVSLAAEQGPNDLHEFVITAYDHAHRLARSVKGHVWANVKYSDMASRIAQRNGLRVDVAATTTAFPHIMQTTDDASFLSHICERSGMTWRVLDRKLIVQPVGTGAATATWGEDLRRFTTRIGGPGPVGTVEVRGWDPKRKQTIVGRAQGPSTHLSAAAATATARSAGYTKFGTATRVMSNIVTDSVSEAGDVATALRERMDSTVTQARGEVLGNPTLVPGMKLTVKGVGATFGGDYVLTSVEHVYTTRAYVTRFHAGTRSPSGLVDLLGAAPRFHGATIGIVTNNRDPDGMSRVKLKLPMVSDELETDWARVVSAGAGAARGLQIIPAVNDEVLVVFDGGDTRHPIVIGGLWNGKDAPPKKPEEATASGATKVWHLQTAAGHKLTFDEREAGKEFVTILLKDGKTKLHLGVDKVELWGGTQTVHVKTGQSNITLDQNNVNVESMNISLKASSAVKIEGATVEVKAQTTAKVAGTIVDVQGQGPVNVQGGGPVSIKGTLVKIN